MELGNQIRKYRAERGLSQEELAEKVFVSRQTVSNWENDKNYPDIHSLLLLSNEFSISLDQLIKGDIEIMKKEVKENEIQRFHYYGRIYTLLLILMLLSFVPLYTFLKTAGVFFWMKTVGVILWGGLAVVTLAVAYKLEKIKKKNNVQTYREIVAFTEGKQLDELETVRESGKRPYQKLLLAIGSAVITFLICGLLFWICANVK